MLRREEKYKKIAHKLIMHHPDLLYLKQSRVKVAYLASDEEKTQNHKIVFADCRKVSKQYSWCCPYDFMITVYEPNCYLFDDRQLEILMLHELQHIGIDDEGNESAFYIVPHDIEEFWNIANAYGLHWAEEGRTQICQEEVTQIREQISASMGARKNRGKKVVRVD